jgi:hypothetical protein
VLADEVVQQRCGLVLTVCVEHGGEPRPEAAEALDIAVVDRACSGGQAVPLEQVTDVLRPLDQVLGAGELVERVDEVDGERGARSASFACQRHTVTRY